MIRRPCLLSGGRGPSIEPILNELRFWTWGPVLAALLLARGGATTVLLRAVQLRALPHGLAWAFGFHREENGEGEITHGRALGIALAGTGAMGGVFGVAAAVAAGGPGALFWIWIGGLLAMATRFAEAVLSVRYRETDARGEKSGGPMYYLEHGLRGPRLGRGLAVAFALLLVPATLGLGAGLPSTILVEAVGAAPGLPRWIAGTAAAGVAATVIVGGVRRIGQVAGVAMPVLLVGYVGVAGASILLHADRLPEVLRLVFDGAFGVQAVTGGALGFGLWQAIRHGLAQGLVAGHAGLGSGAIAAAAARTREPVRQALVAMTGPFLEAVVVGTATGLALLCAGAAGGAAAGGARGVMPPGGIQPLLAAVVGEAAAGALLALLAVATMIAWSYYGERAVAYVAGERAIPGFRLAFLGVVLIAAPLPLEAVWRGLELFGGLAALPNLAGLALLSGIVRRETRSYLGRSG